MAEVISRHYLDALAAMPDAPDVADIRAQAIGMLVRSAERAVRAGAPRPAAASYALAAEQAQLTGEPSDEDAAVGAARLWEGAARAALNAFDVEAALAFAGRADELYAAHGRARAAARSKAIAGEVLMRAGRHGEARERLTAALAVLRPDPDADTVTAVERLAAVEILRVGPTAIGSRRRPSFSARPSTSMPACWPTCSRVAPSPSTLRTAGPRRWPLSSTPRGSPKGSGQHPTVPCPAQHGRTARCD